MAYEDYTYETIMEDMMERVTGDVATNEGSLVYEACSRMALAIEELYDNLSDVEDNMYMDTADLDHLIALGAEMGLPINEATYAQFKARFNIEVEEGTEFEHDEYDLTYTVMSVLNNDTHTYIVEADDEGSEPNDKLGSISPVEMITGFETGELLECTQEGENEEAEEDYRERLLDSFGIKSHAGNRAYYIETVDKMAGVGGCKATRAANPGDAVQVVIIASDYTVPSASVVNAVQEALDPDEATAEGDGVAPIGASVEVSGVSSESISVAATITPATGVTVTSLEDDLDAAVDEYFKDVAKTWEKSESNLMIRLSQLEVKLMGVEGVVSVDDLTISDATSNHELAANTIAERGTTTWTSA